jgi:hypothetical protein
MRTPAGFGILLAGLLAVIAGGCAQTVSAEKFLTLYRLSAPPGHMEEGWEARYTGRDADYHYLEVRHSTANRGADQLLLYGASRDEIYRCPLGALPPDFPEGFSTLNDEGTRSEPEAETKRYIRYYLGRLAAPPPGPSRGP